MHKVDSLINASISKYTGLLHPVAHHLRLAASRMRKIYKNRLMISKYKLMDARIYSSGDNLCIIICVSNIMKPQNTRAPPSEITNSNSLLCIKTYKKIQDIILTTKCIILQYNSKGLCFSSTQKPASLSLHDKLTTLFKYKHAFSK